MVLRVNIIFLWGILRILVIFFVVGFLFVLLINCFFIWSVLYVILWSDFEMWIGLLFCKYLWIFLMIIGIVYVENLILWLRLKLLMDFISLMQLIWNKLLIYFFLLLNFWMMFKIRCRLLFISFFFVELLFLFCNCLNSFFIFLFLSIGNLEVLIL